MFLRERERERISVLKKGFCLERGFLSRERVSVLREHVSQRERASVLREGFCLERGFLS